MHGDGKPMSAITLISPVSVPRMEWVRREAGVTATV